MPLATSSIRLALAAMLSCASCLPSERITVADGFPFIDAKINGRGPFRLLIDTGSSSCMLSPGAARKAGLVLDHRVILTTVAGEKIISGAWNSYVEAGGAGRSGVEIVVADMRQVRRLDLAADGVLGENFLSQSPYLIDYKAKRLWLGDEAIAQSDRLPIVVSSFESHGRTVLPVKLDSSERPWQLTLDSGATNLVVSCSERCPGLRDLQKDSLLATHIGERPVSRGILKQVEIGGVAMPAAEAVLLHAQGPDGVWDGVLPARWFSAVYVNRTVVRLALGRY